VTGREYLAIFLCLVVVIVGCLILLGLHFWDRRRRVERMRPERAEPYNPAAVIREHLALADRHQEDTELGKAA
jgi:hypothetical protein